MDGIHHEDEFKHMAEDVFHVLVNFIIGKYVLEDVGTKYFMNWGTERALVHVY